MRIKVRKLKLKELPAFIELFNSVLTEDFPEYQPRVALIYRKHIFNKIFFKKNVNKKPILGAFLNNSLAGALQIFPEEGGVIHFEWLLVDKKNRNIGVGSSLIQGGETWALKHKYHYIYLSTENQKNIDYYKKRGYKYVGLQRNAWFGVDEHLMQKVLLDKPFEEVFKKYK